MVQYCSTLSVDLLHGETFIFIWKVEPFTGTHIGVRAGGARGAAAPPNFGQMVYRPPWPKIARTPMGTHCRRNPSAPGLFCRDYQQEQCLSIKDHFGFIHGERKWLKQICVACWTRLRQQESHRKISSDCPLKALAAKDSPATPKN